MFLSVLLLFVQAPASQSAAEPIQPTPLARAAAALEPDILLDVRVRADQVRWRQAGRVDINAQAEPGGRRIEENLSTGVPRPIVVGRTFRNVDWRLTAGARIEAPELSTPPADADAKPQQSELP